ncbi:hypothetical protein CRG98_040756, partial [Punica granatum]
SCRNESWNGIAKYLADDVPLLLKFEDVKDIKKVIGIVCASLPSDFEKFIQWVAEVRRAEDGGTSISQEEKGRLAAKDEVLKQVQETGLYKHILDFLSSSACCRRLSSLTDDDNFHKVAASICCQGAEILAGKTGSAGCSCCQETCVKCLKTDDNDNKPVAVLSATVLSGQNEEKVDVLVPPSLVKLGCGVSNGTGSGCIKLQKPAGSNILTALLLALPPETWSGIKNEELLRETHGLVCTENLPPLLQEEILHLRRQLYLLKKCQENKVDEDLSAPSI